MIKEIHEEVLSAINQGFKIIYDNDKINFILYISRADVIPGLKEDTGTDCVVDYQLDRYYDETREAFYLHYLNRNYKQEGFCYEGELGIDDLSIEMMIYCHLWDSHYFLKSLYRLATLLDGKDYLWNCKIDDNGKWKEIKDRIIDPLNKKKIELGTIVQKAYSSDIRNAFAHSLYNVDVLTKTIFIRVKRGNFSITFEEFQRRFLYSVILMNKLQNILELNHDRIGSTDMILTNVFKTPDGLDVIIKSEMVKRGDNYYPEFRMCKV